MSRLAFGRLLVLSVSLAITSFVAPAPLAGQDAHSLAVDRAVDLGVKYLLDRIQAQQLGQYKAGQVALETYALVVAGVNVDHPLIKKNFAYLKKELPNSTHTYSLACYVFALDAATAQLEEDREILRPRRAIGGGVLPVAVGGSYRTILTNVVRLLIRTRNPTGVWRYHEGSKGFDNSNVQFAVLALGVGAKRGVSIDDSVWHKIVDHFVAGQQNKGPVIDASTEEESGSSGRTRLADTGATRKRGWDYQNKGGASWNMTCAGVSSLLLARDNIAKKLEFPQFKKLSAAIRDGNGWLMGNWHPTRGYYGMYSLEKVADIGGIRRFAAHDWYRELSSHLVRTQQKDGSWRGGKGPGEKNVRVDTSFALLVLNRASRLVNPVIYTGKRGARTVNDQSWVFVQRLNKHVHYPALMRMLRYRPTRRLAKLLEDVVEDQPADRRGALVGSLVMTYETVEDRSIRKILGELLVKITGVDYADPRLYSLWHQRWQRVAEILQRKEKQAADELLRYYGEAARSLSLKKKITDALVLLRVRNAIPRIFGDLSDERPEVRAHAHAALQSFYVDPLPPFDAEGSDAQRKLQKDRIREWLRVQEKAQRRKSVE